MMACHARLASSLAWGLGLIAVGGVAPAQAAGAATPGSLRFVAAYSNGSEADGIGGASGIAVSPDSRHVYVTGAEDDGIAVFARGGGLTFVEADRDGEVEGGETIDGLEGAADVAVSPDGESVYVAGRGDDAVATFARGDDSGALRLIDVDRNGIDGVDGIDGANGLAVSPDGRNVYVAGFDGGAVAAFARNPATGELEFVERYVDTISEPYLDGPFAVGVAPGGAAVYVASFYSSAVVAYRRSSADGTLGLANVNGAADVFKLDGPVAVAPSPYGQDVYTASLRGSALHRFRRSSAQALDFQGLIRDGFEGVDGIAAASGVVVSPDAASGYATGALDDAMAFFEVRDSTGELLFRDAYSQGDGGIDGLDGASGLAVAPDGRRVYAIANGEAGDTLAVFARRRVPLLDPARAPEHQRLAALHAIVHCSRSCTLHARARGGAGDLRFASGRFARELHDDRRYRIELRFHPSVLRALRGERATVRIKLSATDRVGTSERRSLRVDAGP